MSTISKRERILNALHNKPVDRVPVGFWFHFLPPHEFFHGLEKPELIEQSIAAHKKFIEDTDPDFIKIISDGYFLYPNEVYKELKSAADLRKIKPLGKAHPWIQGQVKLTKAVVDFSQGASAFYNVFSPATLLRFAITDERFFEYFSEDPEAVAYALDVIAQDNADLSKLVIEEAGAEGIYLCVKNPGNGIGYDDYRTYITPSEKLVLAHANEASPNNILHCCGYDEVKNNLEVWKDYDAKAFNWATAIENVGIAEGKKFFGGKAVIGGFDNRSGKVLHAGTKEQIEAFTETLIREAGKIGVILGADCTVPSDIALERLQWVKDKVSSL